LIYKTKLGLGKPAIDIGRRERSGGPDRWQLVAVQILTSRFPGPTEPYWSLDAAGRETWPVVAI
jgi:hypothetical protein